MLTSNVVSLNKVQGYFALKLPKYIFCIGNYLTDWIGPEAANAEKLIPYRVTENDDEIDSNIFSTRPSTSRRTRPSSASTWDSTAGTVLPTSPKTSSSPLGAAAAPIPTLLWNSPDFKAGEQLSTHKLLAGDQRLFSFPTAAA